MSLLEIKSLHVKVDNHEILKGIDLKVNVGEVHSIMGPNDTVGWMRWMPWISCPCFGKN
jgi:Fe-S cluster assembly ATPase SufC